MSGVVIGRPGAEAANKPANIELSKNGKQLEKQYASQLEKLQKELTSAIPKVSAQRVAEYKKALDNESKASAALAAAQNKLNGISQAKGLVEHAKGKWIGGADKAIANAKAAITNAKSPAESDAANKLLSAAEKNRAEGVAALKERQAILDKALAENANADQALKAAEKVLTEAKATAVKSVQDLGLKTTLSSNKLDGKLAKYTFLLKATPKALATFGQQGSEQMKFIETVLADDALLIQMAVADGASNGNYTQAIQIYHNISQSVLSKISKSDVKSPNDLDTLQRLALAVSLEHATPIAQRNAVAKKEAPSHVDPVKRFIHFKDAFLKGELDAAFKDLSVWDLRMVVNGEEPDEILTWGREMLKNYRPDHITTPDYNWRYVAAVRSDVPYGSQDNQFDEDQLQFFQNILKNGGICGRRAFFGRFILRAFGVPTTARPQKGHAALAHWTPKGWVICLGAGWGSGWTQTIYNQDLDFLASTQARAAGNDYLQVKRAQWIGDLKGEKPVYGLINPEPPEFWHGISLYIQKGVIASINAKTLEAVGQDIAEATVTKEKVIITKTDIASDDRKISLSNNGTITIPAVATSNPTKNAGKIIFMDSHGGGKQLHYGPAETHQNFEYTIDVPSAGKYNLTSKIVTPSWRQNFLVNVNGAATPVKMDLPFTVGKWETSKAITIDLKQGKNILAFTREGNTKGISIKEFTLTPSK